MAARIYKTLFMKNIIRSVIILAILCMFFFAIKGNDTAKGLILTFGCISCVGICFELGKNIKNNVK